MVNIHQIVKYIRVVAAVCFACNMCDGAIVTTPAGRASRNLAWKLEQAINGNSGQEPTDFTQLFDEANRIPFEASLGGKKIEERFALHGDAGPNDPELGKIVAITKGRVSEDRREGTYGRYAVLKKGQEWRSQWLSEKEAEAIFAANKMTLPQGEVWKQPDTKGWDGFPFPEPPPDERRARTAPSQDAAQGLERVEVPPAPKPVATVRPSAEAGRVWKGSHLLWWSVAGILLGGAGVLVWIVMRRRK